MPEWSEDFSKRTLTEIVLLQEENRLWQKELRSRAAALVNSRLAKQIGPEEYAVERKVAKDDADECKRRANIIANEVWIRRGDRTAVVRSQASVSVP